MCSMVDPWVLTTSAFKLIQEDLKGAIHKGPIYICE